MAMSACAPEVGEMYNEACRLTGYDHTALGQIDLSRLPNPVVRKVIGECLSRCGCCSESSACPNACMSRWRATSATAATDVLHRIPGHKITRIDELLPLRYAAAAA
jgi:hypothetical protein